MSDLCFRLNFCNVFVVLFVLLFSFFRMFVLDVLFFVLIAFDLLFLLLVETPLCGGFVG